VELCLYDNDHNIISEIRLEPGKHKTGAVLRGDATYQAHNPTMLSTLSFFRRYLARNPRGTT